MPVWLIDIARRRHGADAGDEVVGRRWASGRVPAQLAERQLMIVGHWVRTSSIGCSTCLKRPVWRTDGRMR